MGLQLVAGYLGQAGIQHSAALFRNVNMAVGGRRTGAFRADDFALTPSGAAMQLTIGRGAANIVGVEQTTQGAYFVWSNASEVIAWPAAAGSPRVDTLVLRVVDTDYGVDPGGSKAYWDVVSGTPGGSPVEVADAQYLVGGSVYKPGAWWKVANFTVPAGATNLAAATVLPMDDFTRIGRNVLTRAAGGTPPDALIGDTLTQIDGNSQGIFQHYNGTSWVRVRDNPVYNKFITTSNGPTNGVTTTEALVTGYSLPSIAYRANRAYRIEMIGLLAISAAASNQGGYLRLRKTNLAGQVIFDGGHIPAVGGAFAVGVEKNRYFTVGGSDVTAALVLTGQIEPGAATGTVTANALAPFSINVYDVGPASDYATFPVLV